MTKTIIMTTQAPAAVGPYSQGVVLDGWIWTCGQVALDPATGAMVGSDLTNMDDFAAVNEVYARYFPDAFPARACVEVSRLPLGALVEIDAIAKVAV
jgi:2-iminobutanoate/2-iminopropanoate deaminase